MSISIFKQLKFTLNPLIAMHRYRPLNRYRHDDIGHDNKGFKIYDEETDNSFTFFVLLRNNYF